MSTSIELDSSIWNIEYFEETGIRKIGICKLLAFARGGANKSKPPRTFLVSDLFSDRGCPIEVVLNTPSESLYSPSARTMHPWNLNK